MWHWRLLLGLDFVSVQVHGSPPARMVALAQELNTLSLGTAWPLYPLFEYPAFEFAMFTEVNSVRCSQFCIQ